MDVLHDVDSLLSAQAYIEGSAAVSYIYSLESNAQHI
jgi:hypothetical protein